MVDHRNDPLGVALLAEIAAVDQLARTQLTRALPKGMELSHFMVLSQFARLGGERNPAQLARVFNVTKGAMTNTLSKLEAAGYIHIRPDWDDARRKLVSITKAGIAARERAAEAAAPVVEGAIGELGIDRIRAVIPVLRDLRIELSKTR